MSDDARLTLHASFFEGVRAAIITFTEADQGDAARLDRWQAKLMAFRRQVFRPAVA